MIEKLLAIALAPIMMVTGWFGMPSQINDLEKRLQEAETTNTFLLEKMSDEQTLGTALPTATAVFETSLASPISNSATTMTLVANAIRGGGSLSGFTCFTLDEGSAQAEFVCGTVSGTSVTGMTRGVSPADGVTEDTDLQFAHRRGTNVKITDFPIIQRLKLQNNGEGTYENLLSYATGVTPTGSNHLVDKEYVDATITGTSTISYDRQIVAGTAGETISSGQIVFFDNVQDEWMLADASVVASSTNVQLGIAQGAGTNGTSISGGVLRSGYDETQSGMTPGATIYLSDTAGGTSASAGTNSVVLGQARSAGVLYFDPVYGNYVNAGSDTTFSGDNTLSGDNTFSGSTTTFSGFVDFTGSLSGHASTTFTAYTTSTTWSKPDGLEYIEVWVCGAGGGGGESSDAAGGGGGGGAGCAFEILDASELSATSSVTVTVATSTAPEQSGGTSSFSSFLSATGGTAAADRVPGQGGSGSGGDLNLVGQGGNGGISTDGNGSGGVGGSSHFGGGGCGQFNNTTSCNGGNYGGGGGGAGHDGTGGGSSGLDGGAGAQGIVTIKAHF